MLNGFDLQDVFSLIGLSLAGVGLFLWFDLGVSLTVLGAIFLILGTFGRKI